MNFTLLSLHNPTGYAVVEPTSLSKYSLLIFFLFSALLQLRAAVYRSEAAPELCIGYYIMCVYVFVCVCQSVCVCERV